MQERLSDPVIMCTAERIDFQAFFRVMIEKRFNEVLIICKCLYRGPVIACPILGTFNSTFSKGLFQRRSACSFVIQNTGNLIKVHFWRLRLVHSRKDVCEVRISSRELLHATVVIRFWQIASVCWIAKGKMRRNKFPLTLRFLKRKIAQKVQLKPWDMEL